MDDQMTDEELAAIARWTPLTKVSIGQYTEPEVRVPVLVADGVEIAEFGRPEHAALVPRLTAEVRATRQALSAAGYPTREGYPAADAIGEMAKRIVYLERAAVDGDALVSALREQVTALEAERDRIADDRDSEVASRAAEEDARAADVAALRAQATALETALDTLREKARTVHEDAERSDADGVRMVAVELLFDLAAEALRAETLLEDLMEARLRGERPLDAPPMEGS